MAVEPDREQFCIKLRHQVLERRDNLVDGDLRPSQSKNTIDGEDAKNFGDSGSGTESLASDGKSSEFQGVDDLGSVTVSRAVVDLKRFDWVSLVAYKLP